MQRRKHNGSEFHRALRWMLVFALLFAQSALLAHEVDFKAHQGEHICDICIHGSALGHANIDTGCFHFQPRSEVISLSPIHEPVLALHFHAYNTRAPPVIFFS